MIEWTKKRAFISVHYTDYSNENDKKNIIFILKMTVQVSNLIN